MAKVPEAVPEKLEPMIVYVTILIITIILLPESTVSRMKDLPHPSSCLITAGQKYIIGKDR